MNRVDALVEKHSARLNVFESEAGWIARIEWVESGRWHRGTKIHGLEARGSTHEAALISLDAAIRRKRVA